MSQFHADKFVEESLPPETDPLADIIASVATTDEAPADSEARAIAEGIDRMNQQAADRLLDLA